jgi:hypothetical protein
MWINASNVLVHRNHLATKRWAAGASARHTNHCTPFSQAPADLPLAARTKSKPESINWLVNTGDNHFAACTHENGYDSLLLLSSAASHPEFILTHPECTWPGQPKPINVCGYLPSLRTGWHVERAAAAAQLREAAALRRRHQREQGS